MINPIQVLKLGITSETIPRIHGTLVPWIEFFRTKIPLCGGVLLNRTIFTFVAGYFVIKLPPDIMCI